MMESIVFLGIGSNIGNRENNILIAESLIIEHLGSMIEKSNYYLSNAWGYKDQDIFLNSCLKLSTSLQPKELLAKIHEIEKKMGKKKLFKWGPRLIDIDILFYEHQMIKTNKLTIPQPNIENRMFVLKPLNEIAPNYVHPVFGKTIHSLYKNCPDKTLTKQLLTTKLEFN